MTAEDFTAHISALTLDPYLTPNQYRIALKASPPADLTADWITQTLWALAVSAAVKAYKPAQRPAPPQTGDLFGG